MNPQPWLDRVVRWDNWMAGKRRRGETCTMMPVAGDTSGNVQVRFADGMTAIVDRRALTTTGKVRAQRQKSAI